MTRLQAELLTPRLLQKQMEHRTAQIENHMVAILESQWEVRDPQDQLPGSI